jgi:hypothetical protein
MQTLFPFFVSRHSAGRLIVVGTLALTGLLQASPAAADPFCPGNQPATVDPAFATLVQRVGATTVGSVTTCVNKAGNTGIFTQETSQGTLTHSIDGTVAFETSYQSSTPYQTWTLRPDGTFVTPNGQQLATQPNAGGNSGPAPNALVTSPSSQSPADPTPADPIDPNRTLTPPTVLPADDPAVSADAITPGRYACYAQDGGSTSQQVLRSAVIARKEINSDGTWRDTTYGSLTANKPDYAGTWSFDGTTLTLTWGNGSQDAFTPQLRTSGQPQLVEFDSDHNLTCYFVQ